MMKILNISTECYPAAKAGGLGDVVGALPIYLNKLDCEASVIIPKYSTDWMVSKKWKKKSQFELESGNNTYQITIFILNDTSFPYNLYAVDIPTLFDRKSIYLDENGKGYKDEAERNVVFQLSVLTWLCRLKYKFDVLHCHDHMSGLIPFLIDHSQVFSRLKKTPTLFTIHNGQYQGIFNWSKSELLPAYEPSARGLLEWDGKINSLACAIKCSWMVSTVSPSYMKELKENFGSLTSLIRHESSKCIGILNGIDTSVWNPKTDSLLPITFKTEISRFKIDNKKELSSKLNIGSNKVWISFIGRLAYEKGADLLAPAIDQLLTKKREIIFVLLGSGDENVAIALKQLEIKYPKNISVTIAYNEALSHQIYAASDFLMMPSRFEPCGLNQMYAMRYGTIPIVNHTGGLIDTVPDIDFDGNGFDYTPNNVEKLCQVIIRAVSFTKNKEDMEKLRQKIVALDFSWEKSAQEYKNIYQNLIILSNHAS